MIKENYTYTFKGIHAQYVMDLVIDKNNKKEIGIFNRNIDVLILAPIIGKIFNRKSSVKSGSLETRVINYEQIAREKDKIDFAYRVIMMNETYYDADLNIKKAFKDENNEEKYAENMKLFEEYMLGGVEVLYEKLIGKSTNKEGVICNVYDVLLDIYENSDKIYENSLDSSIQEIFAEYNIK